jgi:hypothetical protein
MQSEFSFIQRIYTTNDTRQKKRYMKWSLKEKRRER